MVLNGIVSNLEAELCLCMFKNYFYFQVYKIMDHTFTHVPNGCWVFSLTHRNSLHMGKKKSLLQHKLQLLHFSHVP